MKTFAELNESDTFSPDEQKLIDNISKVIHHASGNVTPTKPSISMMHNA